MDNVENNKYINYGITTFDDILSAIITIFQVITLEGWSYIMYNHMDSNMFLFSVFYFLSLITLGSFFVLNLILAVIVEASNPCLQGVKIDINTILGIDKDVDKSISSNESDENFVL